jgi:hypothetical protein
MPDAIRIGAVYRNAKPPHHDWRVVDLRDEQLVLERTDNPNVMRFPNAEALRDPFRYRRVG